MLHPSDFFDPSTETVASLFRGCDYVWQALDCIGKYTAHLVGGEQTILGEVMPGAYLSDRPVYIAEGARIEPGAYVGGPAYIGANAVVRHGACVRGNVIMLRCSVLGHASEATNSIFFPGSCAPHFNYIGDSILGHRANLGAGTKLCNLTIVRERDPVTGSLPTIKIEIGGSVCDTGLTKLGAILGDDVQTGCSSVLNPGCLVGPRALIYPNLSLRKGYYPSDSVVKLCQKVECVPRIYTR